MKNLKIKLIKSLNNKKKKQVLVANSLGLKKVNNTKIHPDNPQTRGKIFKINHLLEILEN
ncbi:MAG: 50S ribosomal protein L30 [Candidatus Paraimprobicoccus trichonymphae]|uniref:Large ribosomal subunit protein uL30 n=1 Tax=Candidatus Paraimprobicoccus trichonymphae TaxID=3033793 RepID=A0AA48HWM2_9FIRM|nr:MAG: 50S ribosomal protein L30 [Candidatus Paraimprobicoccus trichonymphae]